MNKWETIIKHIQCKDPLYKGFYSFSEAISMARGYFGLTDFFIEPEEVKTFSDIIKESPEKIIHQQEEIIINLQKHIFQKGKESSK